MGKNWETRNKRWQGGENHGIFLAGAQFETNTLWAIDMPDDLSRVINFDEKILIFRQSIRFGWKSRFQNNTGQGLQFGHISPRALSTKRMIENWNFKLQLLWESKFTWTFCWYKKKYYKISFCSFLEFVHRAMRWFMWITEILQTQKRLSIYYFKFLKGKSILSRQ